MNPKRKCLKCQELRPPQLIKGSGICSVCIDEEETARLKAEMAARKVVNVKAKNKAKARKIRATMDERGLTKKRKVSARRIKAKTPAKEPPKAPDKSATAAQELAKRALARRHLLQYTKMFVPKYKAGWVHKDICQRLEKFYQEVAEEKSPRLMLFMPPRHGKSELASVNFPSWVLGQDPTLEIISCSHTLGLAGAFSRKVRDRIKLDNRYHVLFEKTRLSKSQENIEHWGTSRGGGYVAAGISGPIAGKGAHIAIIDDPVKNQDEADSETVQEKNWDWYRSTFRSRLAPGGGILIIQTRWSFDDISGKVLDQMEKAQDEDFESWEVIEYEALAEQDEYIDLDTNEIIRSPLEVPDSYRLLRRKHEALHPARYDEKALRVLRNTVGTRMWSALYQQKPLPESGDFFKREWLGGATPSTFEGMRHIMAADLALGVQQHNNNSAFAIGAIDKYGTMFIREILHGKWTTHELVELILDKQVEYDLYLVGIERGTTKLAIDDQLRVRMRERKIYPSFDDELVAVTDKRVRARPIQGLMQAGHVRWPENNPWWMAPATKQLLQFDAAADDDIVDALAWLGRMYERAGAPRDPIKRKKQKSWRDQLKRIRREHRSPMSA